MWQSGSIGHWRGWNLLFHLCRAPLSPAYYTATDTACPALKGKSRIKILEDLIFKGGDGGGIFWPRHMQLVVELKYVRTSYTCISFLCTYRYGISKDNFKLRMHSIYNISKCEFQCQHIFFFFLKNPQGLGRQNGQKRHRSFRSVKAKVSVNV